jgi:hypothetical protein
MLIIFLINKYTLVRRNLFIRRAASDDELSGKAAFGTTPYLLTKLTSISH